MEAWTAEKPSRIWMAVLICHETLQCMKNAQFVSIYSFIPFFIHSFVVIQRRTVSSVGFTVCASWKMIPCCQTCDYMNTVLDSIHAVFTWQCSHTRLGKALRTLRLNQHLPISVYALRGLSCTMLCRPLIMLYRLGSLLRDASLKLFVPPSPAV